MANPANSRWRIAAIVLAVVAIQLGWELFSIKSVLKNVFHYDVRVTLKDKETGAIIRGGNVQGPGMSSDDLFNQSTGFGGGMEACEIRGIAYEPREFGFSAAGYKRSSLIVTDDTPQAIVVELEPEDQTDETDDQPAIRTESKSQDSDKPQPEAEGRSR